MLLRKFSDLRERKSILKRERLRRRRRQSRKEFFTTRQARSFHFFSSTKERELEEKEAIKE